MIQESTHSKLYFVKYGHSTIFLPSTLLKINDSDLNLSPLHPIFDLPRPYPIAYTPDREEYNEYFYSKGFENILF